MSLRRPQREEIANVVTHGVGVVASLVGGTVLIAFAARSGNVWHVAGAAVFGVSLLLVYAASTLYHATRNKPRKERLKVLDHCAIFVLIAGTYTPFALSGLSVGWGWPPVAVVWGAALAGVFFKLFFTGRFDRLSLGLYLAMGWFEVVALGPAVSVLTPYTLGWLVAGGVAYTSGTYFFVSRRVPYAHAVWHVFVLAGSGCHFVAVLSQVAPGGPS